MLCTQLIPEKTIGLLIAGCQVYNHAFRTEIPCAALLPSQPHCVDLIRTLDFDGRFKNLNTRSFEFFQGS